MPLVAEPNIIFKNIFPSTQNQIYYFTVQFPFDKNIVSHPKGRHRGLPLHFRIMPLVAEPNIQIY